MANLDKFELGQSKERTRRADSPSNNSDRNAPDPSDIEAYKQWVKEVRDRDLQSERTAYEAIESGIEGTGWKAKRTFETGEIISHYFVGTNEDIRTIRESTDLGTFEKNAIQWGIDKSGDGLYLSVPDDHPRRYINHSCDPNAALGRVPDPRGGEDSYVFAVRPIMQGEEITIDYSTTQLEEWQMEGCKCGSAKCRGTITELGRLPTEILQDYLDRGMLVSWMKDELAETKTQERS